MYSQDFSRSDRLSDQIRTEISAILREEVKDPRLKGLTIIKVKLSKDIKQAFIFFSAFNSFSEIKLEDVFIGLSKAKGFIRKIIRSKIESKKNSRTFF